MRIALAHFVSRPCSIYGRRATCCQPWPCRACSTSCSKAPTPRWASSPSSWPPTPCGPSLGVAFFQFGSGIAEERATPWERFLRTLPLSGIQRLTGRMLSAALFAAAAAAIVIVEAHLINPVSVAADRWLPWLGALLAGGCGAGYWRDRHGVLGQPRAATPLATLAWLLLAYLGGLWATPAELPSWAAEMLPLPAHPAVGGGHPGRRCGARPPRWGTGSAWRHMRRASRSWPCGRGYRRDEGASYR